MGSIEGHIMIFSSYKFIFVFFPAVFCVYWIFHYLKFHSIAKIALVVASLVFYACGSPDFFPFFLGSIFGNYVVGSALGQIDEDEKAQRKLLLLLGVLANVALLGYYKYTDFFIANANALFGTDIALRRIALPVGISFFTFQLIAFLVDSYRGQTKNYSVLDYLLFITFFPQLIVGPIVHHGEVVPQFEDRSRFRLNARNVAAGMFLFAVGCAKKILIADPLTGDAQLFFDAQAGVPSFLDAWFYSVEYTISYYFDLSGYADMAIGLALFFNIEIPENFNSPYKARNFQDYWRRWHITLSRFLGDYIFRSVFRKGSRMRNYYAATMLTFFVSGFWHGAGWTFVVWGVINGIFVCAASRMKRRGKKWPAAVSVPLTLIGVVVLRVLFVSGTFADAALVLRGMTNWKSVPALPLMRQIAALGHDNTILILPTILVAALICFFAPNSRQLADIVRNAAGTGAAAGQDARRGQTAAASFDADSPGGAALPQGAQSAAAAESSAGGIFPAAGRKNLRKFSAGASGAAKRKFYATAAVSAVFLAFSILNMNKVAAFLYFQF